MTERDALKRVNPKDYRYQPNACLCWHVVLDHKDGTGECEYCQCKKFRKPSANQILTDKRKKIDKTIAEKLAEAVRLRDNYRTVLENHGATFAKDGQVLTMPFYPSDEMEAQDERTRRDDRTGRGI